VNALLLAAGVGTRLRPLTDHIPKCLVPIRGKPLLEYWLEALLPHHIDEVLINTHHLAAMVEAFHADSPWRDRIRLVYEPELLGTGGTILANRRFFGQESFLVAHADNLSRFSVAAFRDVHAQRPARAVMTMMTFETDAPSTCGIVETDAQGFVIRFHEKVTNPPGTHANAAVYIMEPEVVEFIASLGKRFVDLSAEVIPRFLGRIATFHNSDYHRDIGTPESLQRAETEYAQIQPCD
jgi:mannose-1-phosphate guanylyltransferase